MRSLIQEECNLSPNKKSSTILYEGNVACIAQIKGGYIKCERTKYISQKLFFTHEIQKKREIDVYQMCSSENLANLFTKSLSSTNFAKLVHKIDIRRLRGLYWYAYMRKRQYTLFLRLGFVLLDFMAMFLMR